VFGWQGKFYFLQYAVDVVGYVYFELLLGSNFCAYGGACVGYGAGRVAFGYSVGWRGKLKITQY
jgi:hypothetical protein